MTIAIEPLRTTRRLLHAPGKTGAPTIRTPVEHLEHLASVRSMSVSSLADALARIEDHEHAPEQHARVVAAARALVAGLEPVRLSPGDLALLLPLLTVPSLAEGARPEILSLLQRAMPVLARRPATADTSVLPNILRALGTFPLDETTRSMAGDLVDAWAPTLRDLVARLDPIGLAGCATALRLVESSDRLLFEALLVLILRRGIERGESWTPSALGQLARALRPLDLGAEAPPLLAELLDRALRALGSRAADLDEGSARAIAELQARLPAPAALPSTEAAALPPGPEATGPDDRAPVGAATDAAHVAADTAEAEGAEATAADAALADAPPVEATSADGAAATAPPEVAPMPDAADAVTEDPIGRIAQTMERFADEIGGMLAQLVEQQRLLVMGLATPITLTATLEDEPTDRPRAARRRSRTPRRR